MVTPAPGWAQDKGIGIMETGSMGSPVPRGWHRAVVLRGLVVGGLWPCHGAVVAVPWSH